MGKILIVDEEVFNYMKQVEPLKFEFEKENNFRMLYGTKVISPKRIVLKTIKRHKKRRINKKWNKRYGVKTVKKEVYNNILNNYLA